MGLFDFLRPNKHKGADPFKSSGAIATATDAVSPKGGNAAVSNAALSKAAPAAGMCSLNVTGHILYHVPRRACN